MNGAWLGLAVIQLHLAVACSSAFNKKRKKKTHTASGKVHCYPYTRNMYGYDASAPVRSCPSP